MTHNLREIEPEKRAGRRLSLLEKALRIKEVGRGVSDIAAIIFVKVPFVKGGHFYQGSPP